MPEALANALCLPCGAILKNRLAKSATQEGLADAQFAVSDGLCRLYRRWSLGGAGLLITGDVMIDRAHMERFGNIVVEGRDNLPELKRWALAGQTAGNHLWMQINHPGRQTPLRFNPAPLAPSASLDGLPPRAFGMPRAMTERDILDVIGGFARTAAIAREAGFTGIQLHAAHGFLISQFLSPLANRRTDSWGGTLVNRARLLIESVRAIRSAVGADFPISVKLNSADFQRGGFDIEDSIEVVAMLNDSTLDLLEISGGNVASLAMMGSPSDAPRSPDRARSTVRREAYFAEYAARIRPVARMPIMITGGFRAKADMDVMLAENRVDLIGMARPFCVDPEIAVKLLSGEAAAAPTFQEEISLDRSAFTDLDEVSFNYAVSAAQLSWLYLQLFRLGRGDEPDFTLPLDSAVAELDRIETAAARPHQRLGRILQH